MNFIRGLLTRDSICRKTRKWRLLTSEEMTQIWEDTYESRYSDGSNLDYDCHIAGKRTNIRSTKPQEVPWYSREERIMAILNERPLVQDILRRFYGKLVIAGGSVFDAIIDYRDDDKDVDFFFIDPDVEKNVDLNIYTNLLLEVLTFMTEVWLSSVSTNVFILRSQFVTTIFLVNGEKHYKYQFIHRVYPDIESLLGGFDIGASMVAYTGTRIVATELGAWSAFSRSIIIDTSRRSTSYEYRIRKYANWCHVIFPGLPRKLECKEAENWIFSEEVVKFVIEQRMRQYDYNAKTKGNASFFKMRSLFDGTLIQCLKEIAFLNDCTIEDPDKIVLHPTGDAPPDVMTRSEFHEFLRKTAFFRGYLFDVADFANYGKCDPRRLGEYIWRRVMVYRLPRMIINLDVGNSLKVGVTKAAVTHHDYGDNPVWPCYAPSTNVTALSHGNLQSVSSILVLTRPDVPIMADLSNVSENNQRMIRQSLECLAEGCRKVTDGNSIRNAIAESFRTPYLGNIAKTIHHRLEEISNLHTGSTQAKRKLYAFFAKAAANIELGNDKTLVEATHYEIVDETKFRIYLQHQEVKKLLQGVSWIVKNPGRQWTASINPIMENPREWYGHTYRSFRIGCEEVETMLRLGRRSPNSPLSKLNNDVFNYILRLVVWENSYL